MSNITVVIVAINIRGQITSEAFLCWDIDPPIGCKVESWMEWLSNAVPISVIMSNFRHIWSLWSINTQLGRLTQCWWSAKLILSSWIAMLIIRARFEGYWVLSGDLDMLSKRQLIIISQLRFHMSFLIGKRSTTSRPSPKLASGRCF